MTTTHLQRQRPHAKGRHQRAGQRGDRRGYPDDGKPWGQGTWAPGAVPFPATAANAGTPGTWVPSGAVAPANVAALNSQSIKASPTTKWLIGQYMQTATAGAPGQAHWDGTLWTAGVSPGLGEILDGTVESVQAYVNALAEDEWRARIVQELVDFERANKNRSTLVSWLDQQLGVE